MGANSNRHNVQSRVTYLRVNEKAHINQGSERVEIMQNRLRKNEEYQAAKSIQDSIEDQNADRNDKFSILESVGSTETLSNESSQGDPRYRRANRDLKNDLHGADLSLYMLDPRAAEDDKNVIAPTDGYKASHNGQGGIKIRRDGSIEVPKSKGRKDLRKKHSSQLNLDHYSDSDKVSNQSYQMKEGKKKKKVRSSKHQSK